MMIFEALNDSLERGELILWSGAFCRFHHRRDGQITIHEILVHPKQRRAGWGTLLLRELKKRPGATCIVARCPADLDANAFYAAQGFEKITTSLTRSGRGINLWRLQC